MSDSKIKKVIRTMAKTQTYAFLSNTTLSRLIGDDGCLSFYKENEQACLGYNPDWVKDRTQKQLIEDISDLIEAYNSTK